MRIVIVIPVLNEELVLEQSAERILGFVAERLPNDDVSVIVADNGSTDATPEIAARLAARHPNFRHLRLDTRGKGLAIRHGWQSAEADVYVFMDADLSTDLAALPTLVAAASESRGLAIGSRFLSESVVRRSPLRSLTSHGYSLFQRVALDTGIRDLPCGFKAAHADVIRSVLPHVNDDSWFFDSELVVRGERSGHVVREIPVKWDEATLPGRVSRVPVTKLIVRYIRNILKLRKDLKPTPAFPAEERSTVRLMTAVAVALALLPPIAAWVSSRLTGLEWRGRIYLSSSDIAVYLSYIQQARDGALLFENWFTTETVTPAFNPLWLAVGWLAAIVKSNLLAYHLAKALLILPLVAVTHRFASRFFSTSRERLTALGLVMFASGIGPLTPKFFEAITTGNDTIAYSIDLWVAEANVAMSYTYSPHFVASWILLLATLLCFWDASRSGNMRKALWGGLAALTLFSFHPFHAPTIYAVMTAWVGWCAWHDRRHFADAAKAAVVIAALSLPALAYQFWMALGAPYAAAITAANQCTLPDVIDIVTGFGWLAVAWWFGRNRPEWRFERKGAAFLGVWAVTQVVVLLMPLSFARRLLEGLQFPLALMAVPATLAAYRWISSRRRPLSSALLASSIVFVLLPATLIHFSRAFESVWQEKPSVYRFSPAESAAVEWVRDNTASDATFLATAPPSQDIVGWGHRRVFNGHWANTIDEETKEATAIRFFSAMTELEREDLVRRNGITHVWCGPVERHFGRCPTGEAFRLVYDRYGIAIFQFMTDTDRAPSPDAI